MEVKEVIDNVNIVNHVKGLLPYVKDIVNNDNNDVEASNCLKVLESLSQNALDGIADMK